MRRLTTSDALEAVVGKRRQMMLMKSTPNIDDGIRTILSAAPVAGFSFRDDEGVPHTTLVGGQAGFAAAQSPTKISFDLPARLRPADGGGASMVFLVPGVGETLRFNGRAVERSGSAVVLELEEAFVHCAKCILRSRLWLGSMVDGTPVVDAPGGGHPAGSTEAVRGPLADPAIASFLASSPFVMVGSWDAAGTSDTSPKGDRAGFVKVIDSSTLAIPDRKGNQRTDTFHNLMSCDQVALAAVVPGKDELVHLSGTAWVTDDLQLLSTMAAADKPPKAALVVRVESCEKRANEAVRLARLWDQSTYPNASELPDLLRLGTKHMAKSKAAGTGAALTRTLSKGLVAAPKLLRRASDAGYRKDLAEEGYAEPEKWL